MTEQTLEKRPETAVATAERTRPGRAYVPNVDIVEQRDALVLTADMPGVAPDGVDIEFENGMLTIHGRVQPRESEGRTFLLREYGVGDFHRTFQISELVDSARIAAEFKHGVLTLTLPKAESARPRRIEVRTT